MLPSWVPGAEATLTIADMEDELVIVALRPLNETVADGSLATTFVIVTPGAAVRLRTAVSVAG